MRVSIECHWTVCSEPRTIFLSFDYFAILFEFYTRNMLGSSDWKWTPDREHFCRGMKTFPINLHHPLALSLSTSVLTENHDAKQWKCFAERPNVRLNHFCVVRDCIQTHTHKWCNRQNTLMLMASFMFMNCKDVSRNCIRRRPTPMYFNSVLVWSKFSMVTHRHHRHLSYVNCTVIRRGRRRRRRKTRARHWDTIDRWWSVRRCEPRTDTRD